jgi:hypothetical protein
MTGIHRMIRKAAVRISSRFTRSVIQDPRHCCHARLAQLCQESAKRARCGSLAVVLTRCRRRGRSMIHLACGSGLNEEDEVWCDTASPAAAG